MKIKYTKKPTTFDEQIELLKGRGLVVNNEEELSKYLKNISYYHLSSYFKSFQDFSNDQFRDNVNFDDIINLYIFDRKLRILLLSVLEVIEKSFKCSLIHKVSVENSSSHWPINNDVFKDDSVFLKYIRPILDTINSDNKDEGIKCYYKKYNDPVYPPAWTMIDSLTFGQSVTICRSLSNANKNIVCREYEIDEKYLIDWMFGMSILRNFCAHHVRLWNRKFFARMKYNHRDYELFFHRIDENRLYNYLVILQIFICKISPTSDWVSKLEELIEKYNVDINRMGFPDDWLNRFNDIKRGGEV